MTAPHYDRSMKITSVEPIVLRLSQVDTTRADGTQDAFLVKIHTDEGVVGIGEADTSPYVARTIIEMPSSHAVARGLAELLVGEDPLRIGRLWREMWMGAYHYGRAGAALHTISAIDMALWDIAGKAAGLPVAELLGGRRRDTMLVYASEVMPETRHRGARAGRARRFGRLHRSQARLGTARPQPRVRHRAAHRRPRGAGPRSQADGRRRHGLHRQDRAEPARSRRRS